MIPDHSSTSWTLLLLTKTQGAFDAAVAEAVHAGRDSGLLERIEADGALEVEFKISFDADG